MKNISHKTFLAHRDRVAFARAEQRRIVEALSTLAECRRGATTRVVSSSTPARGRGGAAARVT